MEQNTRPLLTARKAAEILGVPETAVVDDIQDGMDGALPAGGRMTAADRENDSHE